MKPHPSVVLLSALLIHAIPCGAAGKTPPTPKAPVAKPATPAGPVLPTLSEDDAALRIWRQEGYAWTPKVSAAYLAFAKAQALKEIAAAGQTDKFPADFLAFVDKDPQVALTVYGFQPTGAANRLRLLRSLELDLGKDTVRGDKYRQLALAMVAVRANGEGPAADLNERAPMKFKIPEDPRVIVDTKPKDRPLDVNDHIINFLNDHAPIPDDGHGNRVIWPELAYDADGKAIDSDKVQPKDIDAGEPPKDGAPAPKKMRRLYASDIIASAELEKEFNEYMKAHGQTVSVNCGTPGGLRLNWRSNQVKGVNHWGIVGAYRLFLDAYRAKGYFPAKPDPAPTAAESLAYYRMIGDYVAKPEDKAKGPRFDFIHAPWPMLVYLAQDWQSVRSRADMWERYLKYGEFHGYGEYTGPIAQVPILQEARRVTPFAFDNGTVQMMIKNGGVCGTMARLCTNNLVILGAPASTAAQPQHCALVRIAGGPGAYNLVGAQYATGGDGSTIPHQPFIFGGGFNRAMYAHQSVCFAVNAGTESFLDTLAARSFHQSLPAAARADHGQKLILSAITLNPYNLAANEDAIAAADTPVELAAAGKALLDGLAKLKDNKGCPSDTLMRRHLTNALHAKLEKLPTPKDKTQAAEVLAFLRASESANLKLNINYILAAEGEAGIRPMLDKLQTDFAAHAARGLPGGPAMPNQCAGMAGRITSLVDSDCPDAIKRPCLDALRETIKGHENYAYRKIANGHVVYPAVDHCALVLAKESVAHQIAKNGLPAFIAKTETAFKAHAASARSDASCMIMADTLTTILGQWTDKKQGQAWAAARLKDIVGHEKYFAGFGPWRVMAIDPSISLLARHAGVKLRPDQEMTRSLLDDLVADLKRHVASQRTLQSGQELANRLASATATFKDPKEKIAWIGGIAAIIHNKDTFEVAVPGKKPQTVRDPVAYMVEAHITQGLRAAATGADQPAWTAWAAIADKSLPPVAPADVHLNAQQAAAQPKIEPFSGRLLSAGAMLRASSANGHDRPLTYKDILRPGLGGWLHTGIEAKPWIQIELPATGTLSGIALVGRYEVPKNNPARAGTLPMKVQTSLDGKTWTDVATFDTAQDVYRVDLEKQKTTARHIRVERVPAEGQKPADFQFRNVLVYGR